MYGLSWAQATRSVSADTAATELMQGRKRVRGARTSLRRRGGEEAGHLLTSVWDTDAYTRNEHPNASTIS